jgi:hypothetical protein
MPAYVEQFERVKRFLGRIEVQGRDSTEYDDDLWAFFQNCWHLKDWIMNDPGVPRALGKRIFKSVKRCSSIIVCADLANRSKHLSLKDPWVDAEVTQRNVDVQLGNPTTSTSEHIITVKNGNKLIALEVAKKAVEEWQDIFKTHGLHT